jgi:cytoplasmic tRNA 2-thiolation protein 2
MRDRTDGVRKAVERYEGFEFVPLRIEDAFDSNWWAKVGGKNQSMERHFGVDLSDEGESIPLFYFQH